MNNDFSRNTKGKNIGIIGGGAAGLAAAVTIGRASDCGGFAYDSVCHLKLSVDLIEKNSEAGRKLLASGNGRCNISNESADDHKICESFFRKLGLIFTSEDEGRLYPYSKQAKNVRDVLIDTAVANGVNMVTDTDISGIELIDIPQADGDSSSGPDVAKFDVPQADGNSRSEPDVAKFDIPQSDRESSPESYTSKFNVSKLNSMNCHNDLSDRHQKFLLKTSDGREFIYDKLIIATGGKAGIQYGSSGLGLRFARNMGLAYTPVLPALVPMIYGDNEAYDLRRLKGVRSEVRLALCVDGKEQISESGEIQFTDYGISGICVFNLSRHMRNVRKNDGKMEGCSVIIDFFPDINYHFPA